jgi:hypothetical protein
MCLDPLRTFYAHNTCISYVTPVCLYIAHRILFSYQAYRFLPEPSSKPESELKRGGNSMEEDVSQSGNISAKHTQFPWAHMCLWAVPTGSCADRTVAEVSQDHENLFRVCRPSMKKKEKAGAIPRICSWISPSGNFHLEIGPQAGCHSFSSLQWQQTGPTGSMVPKGW